MAPVLEGALPGAPAQDGGASPQGLRCAHGDAHASGDYYVLEPLPGFAPILPGETRDVRMLASNPSIQKTEAPAAFHLLLPGEATPIAVHARTAFDSRDARLASRGADDALPLQNPRARFDENAATPFRALDVARSLLPVPLSVKETGGRFALVGAKTTIAAPAPLRSEAAYLRAALGDLLAGEIHLVPAGGPDAATISLALDPHLAVTGHGRPDPEGYRLVVDAHGVSIVGADAAGVFHGIQTLRQLIPPDAYKLAAAPEHRPASIDLPTVQIADAPLFAYRGMHLDVARHFQSKGAIEKLLDLLAAHKLDKFHFHLSDDEGWRLEIPGLPELTDLGAHRGFDPQEARALHPGMGSAGALDEADGILGKPGSEAAANGGGAPTYQGFAEATLNFVGEGSGHYSVADFEEILVYAAERHIDVIPEFDMPAHARAAVQAMERRYEVARAADPEAAGRYRLLDPADSTAHTSVQGYVDNLMNPCLESTYAFASKVWSEVRAMYTAAHAQLSMAHVGGDEPPGTRWWTESPACKSNPQTKGMDDRALKNYFFARLQRIVTLLGATMLGWNDVVAGGAALPGFVSMPWNNIWGEDGEDEAYKEANGGRRVVLAHATNLYMDLAYDKDPDEPGADWAGFVDERRTFEYLPFDVFAIAREDRLGHPIPPSRWAKKTRLTRAGKEHILGLEGLLWSENVKTHEILEYMAFPKILGVAERAWNRETPSPDALPEAWRAFANTLGQAELPRLDYFRAVDVRGELRAPRGAGVNYRVPLPGAVVEGGQLRANLRYPEMTIEYSTDGGATWRPYTAPTAATPSTLVRATTSDGRAGRACRAE
jgi:hexosaminidase